MFRPIRMDHTNCLQVAIKSIQLVDLESSFDICRNIEETSSPDTGLLRARPCSSNRCGPAPPSHRHHFWWHTYQATCGSGYAPAALGANQAPSTPTARPPKRHCWTLPTNLNPSSPMPTAIAHTVFPPTPPHPLPASPTRWIQQSLARSAEATLGWSKEGSLL